MNIKVKLLMSMFTLTVSTSAFSGYYYKCDSLQKNIQYEISLDQKYNTISLIDYSGYRKYNCVNINTTKYCCNEQNYFYRDYCEIRYTYKNKILEIIQEGESLAFECHD